MTFEKALEPLSRVYDLLQHPSSERWSGNWRLPDGVERTASGAVES